MLIFFFVFIYFSFSSFPYIHIYNILFVLCTYSVCRQKNNACCFFNRFIFCFCLSFMQQSVNNLFFFCLCVCCFHDVTRILLFCCCCCCWCYLPFRIHMLFQSICFKNTTTPENDVLGCVCLSVVVAMYQCICICIHTHIYFIYSFVFIGYLSYRICYTKNTYHEVCNHRKQIKAKENILLMHLSVVVVACCCFLLFFFLHKHPIHAGKTNVYVVRMKERHKKTKNNRCKLTLVQFYRFHKLPGFLICSVLESVYNITIFFFRFHFSLKFSLLFFFFFATFVYSILQRHSFIIIIVILLSM